MRYTVLSYIIGHYEDVHEIREKDPEAEYILVTDDHKLCSKSWTIVCDNDLDRLSVWEKCYQIRFHPFKYCHSPICFRIDGSVGVLRSLRPIVDVFEKGEYDMGLMLHPIRDNFRAEYDVWIKSRGYPPEQAEKCLSYMVSHGYDLTYRGLFQMTVSIQRRNVMTEEINSATFETMRKVSPVGGFERLDQTIFSFILNSRYSHLKIMPLSERLLRSAFLQWYHHGTVEENIANTPLDLRDNGELYMFNSKTRCLRFFPETTEGLALREHELLMKWLDVTRQKQALARELDRWKLECVQLRQRMDDLEDVVQDEC